MEPGRGLAGGVEPGHGGGGGVGIHAHAAHHVVSGRPDLHRLLRDVHVGELQELVVHRGQLPLHALGRQVADVQVGAAVRRAARLLHLGVDRAGHVVSRGQLGRAPCLGRPPRHGVLHPLARLGVVLGVLVAARIRKVLPHEALALAVPEDPALAAHALGHQQPHDARRPHHAGRVELHELHVDQLRPGVVAEGVAVAGPLPAVAGDLVRLADAAGRQHHRLRLEEDEAAAFPIVAQGTADPIAVLEQADDRTLHVDLDTLVDAVVLQGADHLQPGAVADVGQARVLVAAEVALEDAAVFRAVEDGPPGFQLADAVGRLLGV